MLPHADPVKERKTLVDVNNTFSSGNPLILQLPSHTFTPPLSHYPILPYRHTLPLSIPTSSYSPILSSSHPPSFHPPIPSPVYQSFDHPVLPSILHQFTQINFLSNGGGGMKKRPESEFKINVQNYLNQFLELVM